MFDTTPTQKGVQGTVLGVVLVLWQRVVGWWWVDTSWVNGMPPSDDFLKFDALMMLFIKLGLRKSVAVQQKRRGVCSLGHAIGTFNGRTRLMAGVRCVEFTGLERVVIQLHGGGYATGAPEVFSGFSHTLSKAINGSVLSVDYRLCPENSVEDAVDDVLAVYKALLTIDNISPREISFLGDSAGGGLVLLALQKMRSVSTLPMPACAVLLSPWTDLSLTYSLQSTVHDCILSPELLKQYAGIVHGFIPDPSSPTCSPLHGGFEGLPPLYFVVGTKEVLLEDSTRAHAKAVTAGVDSKLWVARNMCHCFPIFTGVFPEAGYAVGRIAEFICSH
eukprot:TRINITY_DN879_c4_g5_i1.p1 TRINITY_DN879_c4_g5~~TRINITY_DN879_c4_g5_i1.p1  ORF type:complete len:332 (+),score=62.18 TRINITY_DN879_c4_g5_i1:53-1048(+)